MNKTVCNEIIRSASRLARAFSEIPLSCIADSLDRADCLSARIHSINGGTLVGTAVTIKTSPGNPSLVLKAIEAADPGDVLVIDSGRDMSGAVLDDVLVAYAEKKGIAGIVVDGAVRGTAAIKTMAVPVFAAGATLRRAPENASDGAINISIFCGGTVVMPGDLVVGDSDGLVAIPASDAPHVLAKARARAATISRELSAIEVH